MATNPIPTVPDPSQPEPPLTHDEWRDLVFSLYGSAKGMFDEVGGSEAWIRFLRDDEEQDGEQSETPES